jgi:hypothetical protein
MGSDANPIPLNGSDANPTALNHPDRFMGSDANPISFTHDRIVFHKTRIQQLSHLLLL